MDDYITGVEQVGVDPTAVAETPAPSDPNVKAEPDVYEFKEYDHKEEVVEKPYDYSDYGDYGTAKANPTPALYDEEFGPGVPAETDIRESNVSALVARSVPGRGRWWSVRNLEQLRSFWWLLF